MKFTDLFLSQTFFIRSTVIKYGESGWENQKRKAQEFHGVFRYKINSNNFEISLETGLRGKQEELTVHRAKLEPQVRDILLDVSLNPR